jgi:undecaprenyl phosphate-alpha-L-ara4N flippase subunit ArnF
MNQNANYEGMMFVGISILLSSFAQLFMRAGMLVLHDENLVLSLPRIVNDFGIILPSLTWVFGGLICYSVSLLCWMRVLAQYELSLAYPLLSMSYALVYIGAAAWPRLNETISMTRTIGIILICVGVLIVARTESSPTDYNH